MEAVLDLIGLTRVYNLSSHSSNASARFVTSLHWSSLMARIRISKKDGTSTPYFWSDKDGSDRTRQTVYKQTVEGVKRMKGVSFNSVTNRMRRQA